MKNWEAYKFGSFLNRASRFEERDDFTDYTFSGTFSYAKGIFQSYTKPGIEFNLSKIQRIKKDDFIFCKIMAWEGAFGIAPDECDNTVMSGAFVAYEVDKNIVEPKFLDYYFKIEKNWRKVGSGSTGTNVRRKTLFPEDFEKFEIQLPPLPEQQRIVSKIESVKTKLEQIKELRAEQTKDINNLLFSKYTELIEDAEWLPMKLVAPIIRREVKLKEEELYPELGIRCFGKGTFHKPALTGLELATKKIFQIKKGDLVFSNVFAWEGGIAVAKEEDNNRYGSHRFISCVADREKACEGFLCFHFLSPKGLEDINACSPGGAGRNKTLGLDKLMRIKVPVPDIALQDEFVELLHKVNAIKNHHKQTEKELNELMPSLLDKAFKGEL
jgi:type I restriction enzyme S subunit